MSELSKVVADHITTQGRLDRIGDPFAGLGPRAREIVETHIELLATLNDLADPTPGRRLEPTRNPTKGEAGVDVRPVYCGRLLEHQLEDLESANRHLATFVERPRYVPTVNRHARHRCPSCRLPNLASNWNLCPRCGYRLEAAAGKGPQCWKAACDLNGRPQPHGSKFCANCGHEIRRSRREGEK